MSIERTVLGALKLLSETVDAKDPYTRGHSERVRMYSVLIGKEMGLDEKQIKMLYIASELHDIGKSKILDEILKKPGKLNKNEVIEIYRHPLYSAEIIKSLPGFDEIAWIIASHHEHYNGSGYPSGLSGKKIPLLSRIIAVADVFDAMTSRRVYRRRTYSDREAINYIIRKKNIYFDPDIVDAFISVYKKGYVFMERGNYYFNHHDFFKALKMYDRALKVIDNKDYIYHIRLKMAEIYNRQRNFKKAISLLKSGLESDNPYLGNYYLELTLSYHYIDNIKMMGKYVKLSLKESLSFPDRIRGLRHLLIFYHRTGKLNKALDLYREIEKIVEDYMEKRKKDIINLNEIPDEISLSRAIDMERAKLYDYVGRVMKDFGYLNEAIGLFEKSIELKTIHGDFYGKIISLGGLAEVYILLGELEMAKSVTEEALALSKMLKNKPGIFFAYLKLVEIHSLMGKFKSAQNHLKFLQVYVKHIAFPGSVERLKYVKGLYYFKKGEYDKAIVNLKWVEETTQNSIRKGLARLYLARSYTKKDAKLKAESYYKKCKNTFSRFHMLYLSHLIEEEIKQLKEDKSANLI